MRRDIPAYTLLKKQENAAAGKDMRGSDNVMRCLPSPDFRFHPVLGYLDDVLLLPYWYFDNQVDTGRNFQAIQD